jgi:hypothetical protein
MPNKENGIGIPDKNSIMGGTLLTELTYCLARLIILVTVAVIPPLVWQLQ